MKNTFTEFVNEILLPRIKDDKIEVTEEEYCEYREWLDLKSITYPLKFNGIEVVIKGTKRYTVGQIKKMIEIAFQTFVQDQDNSWKCRHNLKIILQSIDDSIQIEKLSYE